MRVHCAVCNKKRYMEYMLVIPSDIVYTYRLPTSYVCIKDVKYQNENYVCRLKLKLRIKLKQKKMSALAKDFFSNLINSKDDKN